MLRRQNGLKTVGVRVEKRLHLFGNVCGMIVQDDSDGACSGILRVEVGRQADDFHAAVASTHQKLPILEILPFFFAAAVLKTITGLRLWRFPKIPLRFRKDRLRRGSTIFLLFFPHLRHRDLFVDIICLQVKDLSILTRIPNGKLRAFIRSKFRQEPGDSFFASLPHHDSAPVWKYALRTASSRAEAA
jgi:hypothetical protein